jgi:hypothetical protein
MSAFENSGIVLQRPRWAQSRRRPATLNVGFLDRLPGRPMADLVKVFGCRQAYENRPCTNPRAAVMVYGDFEFCTVEVIAEPARRWRWRGLGE